MSKIEQLELMVQDKAIPHRLGDFEHPLFESR